MGLFSSKPYFAEVENHIKYTNHVNDAYFYELKLLNPEDREELLSLLRQKDEIGYKAAEEYTTSLKGQITRAQQRLDNISEDTQAKLVMEIRKAVDIVPFGFSKVKGVYVSVKTAPTELTFQTSLSQPYIPKWYHLAYLSYDPTSDVLSATVSVYSVGYDGQETAVASCEVDLREAIDTTLTRWHIFKWNWPYEAQNCLPQVEIRYWNLKSLEAFWSNLKAKAMAELEAIEGAVENSRAFRLHD